MPKFKIPAHVFNYSLALIPAVAYTYYYNKNAPSDEDLEEILRKDYSSNIRASENKRQAMTDFITGAVKKPGSDAKNDQKLAEVLQSGKGLMKRQRDVDESLYGNEEAAKKAAHLWQLAKDEQEEKNKKKRKKKKAISNKTAEDASVTDGGGATTTTDDDIVTLTALKQDKKKKKEEKKKRKEDKKKRMKEAALPTQTAAAVAMPAVQTLSSDQGAEAKVTGESPPPVSSNNSYENDSKRSVFGSSDLRALVIIGAVASTVGYLLGDRKS